MKAQEDFDFYSPLSVQEALQRLREHTRQPGFAKFSGEIVGTQFLLYQTIGSKDNNYEHNPKLSGYIQAEGDGCRVYASFRVAEQWELGVWGGGCVVIVGGILLILAILSGSRPSMNDIVNFLYQSKLSFLVLGLPPTLYAWWHFRKSGSKDAIRQFKRILAAE